MTRPRGASAASEDSAGTTLNQELGTMYDYLAKIILLGPSGTGKSCLLHRFIKNEWRVLSSQTIGVEFGSKIIKIGTGVRRKRIKLQLWDTAGTERFRSVSRSYYRGAAGAILVYDITSIASFRSLQPFLNDARALASPNLSLLLVGNKLDLATNQPLVNLSLSSVTSASYSSSNWMTELNDDDASTTTTETVTNHIDPLTHGQKRATVAPEGREVTLADASRWASTVGLPVILETSALSGDGVDEVFARVARMILTKIELGDIDPDDPNSGIQYGDGGSGWAGSDGGSSIAGMVVEEGRVATLGSANSIRRRKFHSRSGTGGRTGQWAGGVREWEDVFTLSSRTRGHCCS